MMYEAIDAKKAEIPVNRGCRLLGVSMSGYYAWKRRRPSLRQYDDMILLAHIRNHFTLSHETYGSPRMHAELKAEGVGGGRHRIARLMRDNGMKALQKRRYKKTTDSDHGGPVAPNVLDQDFSADGWLYLAIVVDLHSRRIIGWATSDRMKKDLATMALRRAIALHGPPKDVVHHSDRGSQYCSADYQKILKDRGFVISMSGRGNCYDNAMVETVFEPRWDCRRLKFVSHAAIC
jgi:putative transposase